MVTSAGGMMLATTLVAFAGGVGMGMTVQTFVAFPKADIRGEMVAALEQHAEAQRVRDETAREAFQALQKREMQDAMRGWSDWGPSGPTGRATAPAAGGGQP